VDLNNFTCVLLLPRVNASIAHNKFIYPLLHIYFKRCTYPIWGHGSVFLIDM